MNKGCTRTTFFEYLGDPHNNEQKKRSETDPLVLVMLSDPLDGLVCEKVSRVVTALVPHRTVLVPKVQVRFFVVGDFVVEVVSPSAQVTCG